MAKTARPKLAGWYEYVDLVEWGVSGLRAKVDTGARTSSIHVVNIRRISPDTIRFDVLRSRKYPARKTTVEANVARRARVRLSSGHSSSRYFVVTRIRIGTFERDIEINLDERRDMLFRMILGRTAFAGTPVLIDVNRACLLGGEPERRKKK